MLANLIFVGAALFGLFPESNVSALLVAPAYSALLLEFCIHDFSCVEVLLEDDRIISNLLAKCSTF